jgi:neopullulanase
MESNHRKTTLQDPHVAQVDKKGFTDGWFVPSMPDLNQRNPMMANYLTQNSIWWIEFSGLDGIRMDTYPYPDMDYMTEWTYRVMKEYPNFNVVGEEWFETQPAIVAYWQKGKVNPNGYTSYLRSLMDFPLRYSLTNALNDKGTGWNDGYVKVYEALAMDFLYADPYELVIFPDNHDMDRFFRQVNQDFDLFKQGILFYMTTRGVPQIYYGTEILMHNDKQGDHGFIRSDFPGGWPGDKVNGFTGEGLSEQQKEAQLFMKKIMNWRKTAKVIHEGKLTHYIPKNNVYVYFRYSEAGKVMVVLNKNTTEQTLSLDRFSEMLQGVKAGTNVMDGRKIPLEKTLVVKAMEGMVLELINE